MGPGLVEATALGLRCLWGSVSPLALCASQEAEAEEQELSQAHQRAGWCVSNPGTQVPLLPRDRECRAQEAGPGWRADLRLAVYSASH